MTGGPSGRPVPPWSEQYNAQDVVGESHYGAAFTAIAAAYGHRTLPDYGIEITEARAAIVHDTGNAFDTNAVAVWIDAAHQVGYLPREVAALYAPRLDALDRGTYLEVPARIWIAQRYGWDERSGEERTGPRGSVTVKMPDPSGVVAFNDLPDEPFAVLPWGRAVQITEEEKAMNVLRTFALGSDPRHVAATLHVVEERRRNGPAIRLVEVCLDEERVGLMSKVMSDQIHDLVTYVTELGLTPVARAVIKGSDLRADVAVHVARTSDVPQKWLDSIKH